MQQILPVFRLNKCLRQIYISLRKKASFFNETVLADME